MKKIIILLIMHLMFTPKLMAQPRFGETLCNLPNYFCMHVKRGDSWENLFPDSEEEDVVQRVNRMNVRLKPGMVIAVPKDIDKVTLYDLSPFPRRIPPPPEKTIYVSQKKLAFGAYNEEGELLWWGPISSGIGKCRTKGGCNTPVGSFRIIRKQDYDCVSTAFPNNYGEQGGAQMPYCMHFYMGYALHGSDDIPGFRASHGCVRLFVEDARWLNEEFIDVPQDGLKGTRVVLDSPDSPYDN
jgi:hypothetical protein